MPDTIGNPVRLYICRNPREHLNCSRTVWATESSMKANPLIVSSFVLAMVLGAGVGCAKKPDDAKISGEIQSKFSQDSGLSTKQLGVETADGVVTLSGTVDNDAQRQAASRQAAAVAGVKTVVNDLQVETVAGLPSKARRA